MLTYPEQSVSIYLQEEKSKDNVVKYVFDIKVAQNFISFLWCGHS